jgi:hypothetical protein
MGVQGIAVDDSAMTFGKLIHRAIATYFNRVSNTPDYEEIAEVARKAFTEIVFSAGLTGYKQRADTILKNFTDYEIKRRKTWNTYKPLFVEKKLECILVDDVPPLLGILDFYGDKRILDWKSGLGGLVEDRMVQGKTYEVLAVANSFPTDKVIFLGLSTNLHLENPRVSNGWLINEARRMMTMVGQRRFPRLCGKHCEWCEYVLDCELLRKDFWGEMFWS